MRGVIYARYSSDNQREESIEGQIRENTAYARKNGIDIVGTYIDRAYSAKTDNRPEFQRMIKDSANLEYTGVQHENGGFSATNSGLFAAVLQRGDVKAIVNGHDHVNDYMVKYNGVMLCYSSTVSPMAYSRNDILGARVFTFSQDEYEPIDTYMSYINK